MVTENKSPNLAPIWRRALSFIIDLIIVEVFLVSWFWMLIKKSTSGDGFTDTMSFLAAHPNAVVSLNIITLYIALVVMAYFVILEYTIGQTIGMILFKLKAVSTHNHSHWWQFIVRNLFLIPIFPFILLALIDPIYLLWKRGECRALEQISGTRTVMA
ncbi:MAG: RDD family protein [Nanoarchaeota archaeon]